VGFALLLAATPVFAQKIKPDYEKSNDFTKKSGIRERF
jgi:hypothetical protein